MSDSNAVFGYGSLILPTSAVARFSDEVGLAKPKYEQGKTLGDDGLLRESAVEVWEDVKDDLEFVPVKLPGFRRNYTWESDYGGTMLEAEHTGDSEDMINGVLIRGLDQEQHDAISSSEDGYDIIEIDAEEAETYIDAELEGPVTVYVESEDERSGLDTSRTRNETYHSRILKGIEMLEEMYPGVGEEFREDFLDSTYEIAIPGTSTPDMSEEEERGFRKQFMNSARENDRAVEAYAGLMDSI